MFQHRREDSTTVGVRLNGILKRVAKGVFVLARFLPSYFHAPHVHRLSSDENNLRLSREEMEQLDEKKLSEGRKILEAKDKEIGRSSEVAGNSDKPKDGLSRKPELNSEEMYDFRKEGNKKADLDDDDREGNGNSPHGTEEANDRENVRGGIDNGSNKDAAIGQGKIGAKISLPNDDKGGKPNEIALNNNQEANLPSNLPTPPAKIPGESLQQSDRAGEDQKNPDNLQPKVKSDNPISKPKGGKLVKRAGNSLKTKPPSVGGLENGKAAMLGKEHRVPFNQNDFADPNKPDEKADFTIPKPPKGDVKPNIPPNIPPTKTLPARGQALKKVPPVKSNESKPPGDRNKFNQRANLPQPPGKLVLIPNANIAKGKVPDLPQNLSKGAKFQTDPKDNGKRDLDPESPTSRPGNDGLFQSTQRNLRGRRNGGVE